MILIDILSYLIGLYISLSNWIEGSVLDTVISLYRCMPQTEHIFSDFVANAYRRLASENVKLLSVSSRTEKYIYELSVLRWGFTETMLVKLAEYKNTKEIKLLVDGDKILEFSIMEKSENIAKLDGKDFEFCAGDILI